MLYCTSAVCEADEHPSLVRSILLPLLLPPVLLLLLQA
jgi:hypothetical protein